MCKMTTMTVVPLFYIYLCWISHVSCQNSSVQPDVLVKLEGVEEAEAVQLLLEDKAPATMGALGGTSVVTKQDSIDKQLYTLDGQCTPIQTSLLTQCTAPFQVVVDDALSAFTSGLSHIRENIQGIYVRTCDRLAVFRSCVADLPNSNDCQMRSCLLSSVIKGCSHQSDQEKHWKCLFGVITNQEVVKCYLPSITSPRHGRKLDDPDLWRDVVPQIMTCSQTPLEDTCGQETVDFLKALTAPIEGAQNVSACPQTLLKNLALPENLDYRSGTIDPAVLIPDPTYLPGQSSPAPAIGQSKPSISSTSLGASTKKVATGLTNPRPSITSTEINSTALSKISSLQNTTKVPTKLSPATSSSKDGKSETLSNVQKGSVKFPQLVTQPVTPGFRTGGSDSLSGTKSLEFVTLLACCHLVHAWGLSSVFLIWL